MSRKATLSLLTAAAVSASILGACANSKGTKASIRTPVHSNAEKVEIVLKDFASSANGPYIKEDPANMEFAGRIKASGLRMQIIKNGLATGEDSQFKVFVNFITIDPANPDLEHDVTATGILNIANPKDIVKNPPTLKKLDAVSADAALYAVEAKCYSPDCTTVVVRLIEPNVAGGASLGGGAASNSTDQTNQTGRDSTGSSAQAQAQSSSTADAGTQTGKKMVVAIFRDEDRLKAEAVTMARRQAALKASGVRPGAKLTARNATARVQTTAQNADPAADGTSTGTNVDTKTDDPNRTIDFVLWWISAPDGVTQSGFARVKPLEVLESQRKMNGGQASMDEQNKVPLAGDPGVGSGPGTASGAGTVAGGAAGAGTPAAGAAGAGNGTSAAAAPAAAAQAGAGTGNGTSTAGQPNPADVAVTGAPNADAAGGNTDGKTPAAATVDGPQQVIGGGVAP